MTGRPVVTTQAEEAACLGAAILAGKTVGMFESIEQAVDWMVVVTSRLEPDPTRRHVYEEVYGAYANLYEDLLGMFDRG